MLRWIGTAIDFLTKVFAWATFVLTLCFVLFLIGKRPKLRKGKVKWWLALCLSALYATAFLIVRLFFSDTFYGIFSLIFIFACLVGMIWSRYEDRVNGKRWWTQ